MIKLQLYTASFSEKGETFYGRSLQATNYFCGWINQHGKQYVSVDYYLWLRGTYMKLPRDLDEMGTLPVCQICPHQLACISGLASGEVAAGTLK